MCVLWKLNYQNLYSDLQVNVGGLGCWGRVEGLSGYVGVEGEVSGGLEGGGRESFVWGCVEQLRQCVISSEVNIIVLV